MAVKKAKAKGKSVSKKAATPKVVGQRKTAQEKSLAKGDAAKPKRKRRGAEIVDRHNARNQVLEGFRKARPQRYKYQSAKGSAPKRVPIDGRHEPSNRRYKTGYWRPVREPWMTNAVWAVVKALHRDPAKWMSKALKKASLNPKIYGKLGPGHAGYGTGELQKWSDYVLRQNKGIDPHQVDLLYWFKGAAEAFNYHFGGKDFNQLIKDPNSLIHAAIEAMIDEVPALKKLTKRDLNEIRKHKWNTISYGPDGRAK